MGRQATGSNVVAFRDAGWGWGWVRGLLLVAAVLIAYQPVWQAGFVWDDDMHLTRNPCVVGPLGFKEIWTSNLARICPLVLSSFRVQHALWGLNPLPYHLVTVFMHAGAVVVLWRVLLRLRVPGAWAGAALWALHPVQVESVAWITELKNTQSGLFYMLTGLFFVRARLREQAEDGKGARRNDWAALAFGALATASKSSTVILPLVLGLCGWWVERGWRWRSLWRLTPYFVLAGLSSALSIWTQRLEGAGGAEWVRSWPERLITAGKVVWFYLGKLVWPHPLIFIYPKWEIDVRQVMAFAPLVLVVVVMVVLWQGRRGWSRGLFMAFAYFVVALLPVLGLVDHFFLRYSFVGDHFQYLASVGPLALVGAGLWMAFERAGRKNLLRLFASGVLLGTLGLLSWQQCWMYADDVTLWRTTIARNPNCWAAHSNLGVLLAQQRKWNEAIQHFELALQIKPGLPEVYNSMGLAFAARGQWTEAIRNYEQALKLDPSLAEAHSNLGLALARQGRWIEAIRRYECALQLRPDLVQAHYNLAEALRSQEKWEEAIQQCELALKWNSNHAGALNTLGLVFAAQGKWDEATASYQRALAIRPNYAEAHHNLALALAQRGQWAKAMAHYQQVLVIQPEAMESRNNLAWLLATCPQAPLRNGPKAVELAREVDRLSGGKDPEDLDTLAAAYAEAGQFPQAVETAERALTLAMVQTNSHVKEIRARLKLYLNQTPYHQPPARPE